jgi:HPt (histidine-containing phosphotransfer) domain-containing protein
MTQSDLDSADTPPLVDTAILDGLRAALGPATDAIVEKAATVVEDRMARIAALAAEPVSEELARIAHEVGGVSGQVGLARLSQQALALEQLCRAGEDAAARKAAEDLAATARDSMAAVGQG